MSEIVDKFVEELERTEKEQDLYHSVYFIPRHYQQEDDDAV